MQVIPGMMKALRKKQTKFQLGINDNLFDFTYVGNAAYAHILGALALVTTAAKFGSEIPSEKYERADGQAFMVTNTTPVYFWDFARSVWAAAEDPVSLSAPQSIIAINEPIGLFIATLLEWIFWALFLGKKQPSMTRGIVKYSCMTRYFDTGKAQRVLGYKAVVGLPEAVKRTVDWFREKERREAEGEQGKGGGEGMKEVKAVVIEKAG